MLNLQTQDMDSIKDQLQKCKRENYTLEADLRGEWTTNPLERLC